MRPAAWVWLGLGHVQVEGRSEQEALEVTRGIVGYQQNGAVAGTEQARSWLRDCCAEHGFLVGRWAVIHMRVLLGRDWHGLWL